MRTVFKAVYPPRLVFYELFEEGNSNERITYRDAFVARRDIQVIHDTVLEYEEFERCYDLPETAQ
jgi:hypothetical protein